MTDENQRQNQDPMLEPHSFAMPDHQPFAGSAPTRPDDAIRSDIETALFYDEAVSSLGVNVDVHDGTITLGGSVNSDLAKRVAGEDAWRVSGVRNVINNLCVAGSEIPSRAAGQDVINAKPPEPIFGQPPTEKAPQTSQPQSSGTSGGTKPL